MEDRNFEEKNNTSNGGSSNNNHDNNSKNNIKSIGYIVYTIHARPRRKLLRTFVVIMAFKSTSRTTEHQRTSLCHPKNRTSWNREVELSVGIGARGRIMMMCT